MPYLIELLWPLEAGHTFELAEVRQLLTERFGGLTAHTRAPAEGIWEAPDQTIKADAIVVIEVMADEVDRRWWSDFRRRLEHALSQDEIVIRAHAIDRL